MANKHRSKKHHQRSSRPLARRLRGPGLLLGVIGVAVAGFVALVTLGMVSQGEEGIERLEGISAEGRTLGEANAPVTIIEFADYQCPHCKEFEQDVAQQLQEEYISKGLVRLEFRNMALLGDESYLAAQAAECANDQGKFWEYHDLLFENQRARNSGAFSSESIVQYAEELGLDVDRFISCMKDGTYEQQVLDETEAGQEAGGSGTPFFIVTATGSSDDSVTLQGNRPFSEFRSAIEEQLALARASQ